MILKGQSTYEFVLSLLVRLMLKTPKETLKAISRKEEAERRMESANPNKKKIISKLAIGEKDHLPFAKLKVKIASSMPDAPKLPTFKVSVTAEY